MYNNININNKEKLLDIDKQDLSYYSMIDGISSRNFVALKYKNDKRLFPIKSKNSSLKSSDNKISAFSTKEIKPKFSKKCLLNEIAEKSVNINKINNKQNNLKLINKNNENKNKIINKVKINKIFINALQKDNSINQNIINYESMYKIHDNNLSYLFDKSNRDFSDSFKSAKNMYNDLIKKKVIFLKKIKLLKGNKFEESDFDEKKHNKITQTNIEEMKNDKNNKASNIQNNSSNFEKEPITNFLNRKKLNNLPLTFPLCLLHKIKYNTASEKNRIENILNKFICLKTHIVNDPSNKQKIIKEFILKNTNMHKDKLSEEKIENFLNFLKFTLNFSPNKTLKEIIHDAMNFQKKINLKPKLLDPNIYMRSDFEYNIINNQSEEKFNSSKYLDKNKPSLPLSHSLEVDLKKFSDFNNKTFNIKNKKLTDLMHGLEDELNEIKNYQLVQYHMSNKSNKNLKNNNDLNSPQKSEENNKNMKNICLISRGISQKYKSFYNDYYTKYNHSKNELKKKSLKKINERMYYKTIRKNFIQEFDTEEIKKKLKLTEYIVLQRVRQALMLTKEKAN